MIGNEEFEDLDEIIGRFFIAYKKLISKEIFHGFLYSKKPTNIFTFFFALVSKMGQNNEI